MTNFALMIEFHDRMKEAKTDFNYFPEEWENGFLLGDDFKDYPRLSTPEELGKGIPFIENATSDYKGFLEIPAKRFKIENLDKVFVFSKNGKHLYSQFEKKRGDSKIVETNFYHKDFFLNRVFRAERHSPLRLEEFKRVFSHKFIDEKIISVEQTSRNYFNLEFYSKKEKMFDFFLDGCEWDFHRKYIDGIKAYPELFLDVDLLKDYFSISFEGHIGNNNKHESFFVGDWISKWQNA